jgi:ketosteroid isomerase-like protein
VEIAEQTIDAATASSGSVGFEGRGRGSGLPVDAPMGAVLDFRDGRVWRARSYLDHGQALRPAGLTG